MAADIYLLISIYMIIIIMTPYICLYIVFILLFLSIPFLLYFIMYLVQIN